MKGLLDRSWLTLFLGDEDKASVGLEGPVHTRNPHWELDGAMLAKKGGQVKEKSGANGVQSSD